MSSVSSVSSSTHITDVIRQKLEKVLSDKDNVYRSARATFRQFDQDGSGTLNGTEIRKLLQKLCHNLQLPPIEEKTLNRIISKYDDGDGELTLEEFAKMYYDLLLLIRDKFYPSRTVLVRRAFFVGRKTLQGQKITEHFDFVRKLGAGSFGEVHLVNDKHSKLERVCKTINKINAQAPVEQVESEIRILKELDHPNIIKIFEVYEDFNNIYIIMELCEGGEMIDRLITAQKAGKRLTEKYVAMIVRQMMEAISYCHAKKIAHKDLKPENVMFMDKTPASPVKVIDFGVAELFKREHDRSHKAAGTALYMAPEVYDFNFGVKCDIWSAGCITYLLLTGRLPFMGRSIQEVKRKVQREEPNFTHDCRHLSEEAVDLLKKMLTKDHRQRLSSVEVTQHPWFKRAPDTSAEISDEIVGNMQRYVRQSGLKNALVNMMAHQLNVSGPQIRRIVSIFKKLDSDGNGMLSKQELTEGLEQAGLKPWDVNRIIDSLDMDGTGMINYTELIAACYTWRESEMNIAWAAFSKLDSDGNGRVTKEEFARVLFGHDPTKLLEKENVEKMMSELDKNGDGFIEWDEFRHYIERS